MSDKIVLKLKALQNNLSTILRGSTPREQAMPPRYYDPKFTEDLFTRFYKYRDEVRDLYPSEFEDFPIREERSSGTTDFENRGYFTRSQLIQLSNDIEYCIELLDGFSSIGIPAMTVTKEGVFFAGQHYDAIVYFRDLINQAIREIIIIDGYISDKLLDMLTNKQQNVAVKILTKSVNLSLSVYANKFNQQYSGLEIGESNQFHDRFVIIDDMDFYHYGHSIKDLGNKGFMFSKIEEPFVIDSIRKEWNKVWGSCNKPV